MDPRHPLYDPKFRYVSTLKCFKPLVVAFAIVVGVLGWIALVVWFT